jgi:hypothetical protein
MIAYSAANLSVLFVAIPSALREEELNVPHRDSSDSCMVEGVESKYAIDAAEVYEKPSSNFLIFPASRISHLNLFSP